jgi:hypothetical protein
MRVIIDGGNTYPGILLNCEFNQFPKPGFVETFFYPSRYFYIKRMSIESVNIYVAEGKSFPCPVGWTVDRAERRIRSENELRGGGIRRNGLAMDSDDLITSDGDYQFVNYQEHIQGAKRSRVDIFYQTEAILRDSKKTKGYRASMFRTAQHCLAYYALEGLERTIFYEEGSSDLMIRLLFTSRRDAELFQNELLDFAFLHPHFRETLTMEENVKEIEAEAGYQPIRVFYSHYHTEDNTESPEMSLNDVSPTSPSASVVSISHDPSFALQALEEERIIRQFDSKWYKCHLISRTVGEYKNDLDNIIYASHTFHQLFDGLNTEKGIGVLVKFERFGDIEEVLVGNNIFEKRQKIFVVVQFRDRDIATDYGRILKLGSTKLDDYSYSSFVYARNGGRMRYFLEAKCESSLPFFQDIDSVSDTR